MTQTARPWTLTAAFVQADARDKCMAEVQAALSSAQIYRTEMTDGRPALGIEHASYAPLTPLLSHIASQYLIVSISMYQEV